MEFTEEALKAELGKIKPEDGKDIVDKMASAIYNWIKSATVTVTGTGTGAEIAAKALEYVGCDYVYGGAGPTSFDCSGLTMYVYGLYGYSLPHGATGQASCGIAVDKSELQPGDLVLFTGSGVTYGHVGIYIGDDQFVHASTYGVGVITSSLSSNTYVKRYSGARRIIY